MDKGRRSICISHPSKGTSMTYEMAMKILDRVREGIPYPESIITKALEMTGDIDGYGTF